MQWTASNRNNRQTHFFVAFLFLGFGILFALSASGVMGPIDPNMVLFTRGLTGFSILTGVAFLVAAVKCRNLLKLLFW